VQLPRRREGRGGERAERVTWAIWLLEAIEIRGFPGLESETFHPMDEDLSVGTPVLGHPALSIPLKPRGVVGEDDGAYLPKVEVRLGPASASSMTATVVISSRSAHLVAPR
jgi:hypothetical protein